jgi:hypothetical protein
VMVGNAIIRSQVSQDIAEFKTSIVVPPH